MKLGVIGGSGLYEMEGFSFVAEHRIETPYGEPSDVYREYDFEGVRFVFLSRHGQGHRIPPHRVHFRANIQGFALLGIDRIISITAVGGIHPSLKPGDIAIPHNAIDMTSGREHTFYDEGLIHHIDFTDPFCPELRQTLLAAASSAQEQVAEQGVYICTNGPRLETAAEITAYSRMGADLVGMTLFPECSLAREREICYANLSIITNFAAGTSTEKLTTDEVVQTVKQSEGRLKNIVRAIPAALAAGRTCGCQTALSGTKISK